RGTESGIGIAELDSADVDAGRRQVAFGHTSERDKRRGKPWWSAFGERECKSGRTESGNLLRAGESDFGGSCQHAAAGGGGIAGASSGERCGADCAAQFADLHGGGWTLIAQFT